MVKDSVKFFVGEILVSISSSLFHHSKKGPLRALFNKINCSLLRRTGLIVMPINSFQVYENENGALDRKKIAGNRIGDYKNSSPPNYPEESLLQKELNDVYLTTLQNICFTGNSDILVDRAKNIIINDFCYGLGNNVLFSDSLLYREKKNVGLVRGIINSPAKEIKTGILICGKFSTNYYHELYENLNRLLLLRDVLVPIEVPVLVDEAVLKIPSLNAILYNLLDNKNRQVIPISPNQLYYCKTLYYLDHLHYIIPHKKNKNIVNTDENSYFDLNYLRLQREELLKMKGQHPTPKRLFLSRSNTTSRHFNEEEIFSVLQRYGFVKVFPGEEPFEKQVALFNNAEWIVGGSGAAFSNILFCNSACKAINFRASRDIRGVSLFRTIALESGCSLWHYPADRITSSNGLHSNYYIDPQKFEIIIEKLINKSQEL